ncbi:MAG: FxLYD domain-containing protein [Thermoanaerobaculia bacterium]
MAKQIAARSQVTSPHKRDWPLAIIVLFFVFISGFTLSAQPARKTLYTSQDAKIDELKCSSKDKIFLPILPKKSIYGKVIEPEDVLRSAPPSNLASDADESRNLVGYSGPYYNVEELTGNVAVLERTLYNWPTNNWHVTGLLRNQTCMDIRVSSITAHLIGPSGKEVRIETATVPISDLRPGEPAPFDLSSPIPRENVERVEWQIGYATTTESPVRTFSFLVYQSRQITSSSYLLFGSIQNLGSSSARGTHIVAAWLDSSGRVRYVASPLIQLATGPLSRRNKINLVGNDFEDFVFSANDPLLASTLSQANVAIWGVAN